MDSNIDEYRLRGAEVAIGGLTEGSIDRANLQEFADQIRRKAIALAFVHPNYRQREAERLNEDILALRLLTLSQ